MSHQDFSIMYLIISIVFLIPLFTIRRGNKKPDFLNKIACVAIVISFLFLLLWLPIAELLDVEGIKEECVCKNK